MQETVLVVGATGNIGTSAITAALKSGHNVLAIVRSQSSAEKLIKNLGGSKDGITFVEADVLSDVGVQGVVDKVKKGELPAFQHVWTSVGGEYTPVRLHEITTERLRYNMNAGFEANFYAYRATIPYLLAQAHPKSTFTICTGAQGDLAVFPLPAMTQGPLFSMATGAARENAKTNVRFNEIYLGFRVEVDSDAKEHGVVSSSHFGKVYEGILGRPEIKGARVSVLKEKDIKTLRWASKF